MKMLEVEAAGQKTNWDMSGVENIVCLVSNLVFTKRTIRPVERMIPEEPINCEYVTTILNKFASGECF